MVSINEEACDAPIRVFRDGPQIGLLVIDPRQIFRTAILAPAHGLCVVEHQRSARPPFAHQPVLDLLVPFLRPRALPMEGKAPAPSPDPVMLLHKASKVG